MRAPDRSSRVDRSSPTKALSFAFVGGRACADRCSISTPKFFGKMRRSRAMAASAKRSAGLRRAHLRVLVFVRGSIGVAAISHLT